MNESFISRYLFTIVPVGIEKSKQDTNEEKVLQLLLITLSNDSTQMITSIYRLSIHLFLRKQ